MKLVRLQDLQPEEVSHNGNIMKKVMLRNGEFGNVTNFAQGVVPPGEVAYEHRHEDMGEVFLVEAGRGEISVDGKTYELNPGTCVVVEPMEVHEIRNVGEADLVMTYFGIAIPCRAAG